MRYYYVMNRSGQYLSRDRLWQDHWDDKVWKSPALPKFDTALIGVYEVFEMEEVDMMAIQIGDRILKPKLAHMPGPHIILNTAGTMYWSVGDYWAYIADWNRDKVMTFQRRESAENYVRDKNIVGGTVIQMDFRGFRDEKTPVTGPLSFRLKYGVTVSELEDKFLVYTRNVAPSKRDEYYAECVKLAEKYKIPPFAPNCRYNQAGDQLEVYLTEELSYCDPAAPGIHIMRDMETKAITGVKIQGFLDRLCGADPSRQAMIMDLEFVNRICYMYEDYFINLKGESHKWLPEELEFFKSVIRLWPGMQHKFLQELPRGPY